MLAEASSRVVFWDLTWILFMPQSEQNERTGLLLCNMRLMIYRPMDAAAVCW